MLRRLYDWLMGFAGHRHALAVLAVVSFVESSVFPIPPDALLIPMVLADRRRAFTFAAVCTATSVAGGMLGYAIGAILLDTVGARILTLYGLGAEFAQFQDTFNRYGWEIILIKGMTPIPYKLITIAAGAAGFNLTAFMIASVITRGFRFFLLAALLWRFGEPLRRFIERYLTWVTTGVAGLLVGGFLVLRYL